MNIMAVDLSLTSTGVCLPEGETLTLKPGFRVGMRRLDWLRAALMLKCLPSAEDVVILEGYSFASRGRAVVSLGELGGLIRWSLYDHGVPYVDIPPTVRAKYATGRGNAGKDDVLQQAVVRAGRVFGDNNQADAWWLWQMGLAHYDPENPLLVKMPAANREALEKVEWTETEGEKP